MFSIKLHMDNGAKVFYSDVSSLVFEQTDSSLKVESVGECAFV